MSKTREELEAELAKIQMWRDFVFKLAILFALASAWAYVVGMIGLIILS